MSIFAISSAVASRPKPKRGRESSRATDETGYTQPTREDFLAVRGADTRYHFNHLRAWKVSRDGSVEFALA